MTKPDSAVQLVKELGERADEEGHEAPLTEALDMLQTKHFLLVLEALEKILDTEKLIDKVLSGDLTPDEYTKAIEAALNNAEPVLAAVAEAAKKALP